MEETDGEGRMICSFQPGAAMFTLHEINEWLPCMQAKRLILFAGGVFNSGPGTYIIMIMREVPFCTRIDLASSRQQGIRRWGQR